MGEAIKKKLYAPPKSAPQNSSFTPALSCGIKTIKEQISTHRLKLGGPPIIPTQISPQNTNDRPDDILLPLFSSMLRVCLTLYIKKL